MPVILMTCVYPDIIKVNRLLNHCYCKELNTFDQMSFNLFIHSIKMILIIHIVTRSLIILFFVGKDTAQGANL